MAHISSIRQPVIRTPVQPTRRQVSLTLREVKLVQRIRQLQNVGRPATLIVEIETDNIHCRKVGKREDLGGSQSAA